MNIRRLNSNCRTCGARRNPWKSCCGTKEKIPSLRRYNPWKFCCGTKEKIPSLRRNNPWKSCCGTKEKIPSLRRNNPWKTSSLRRNPNNLESAIETASKNLDEVLNRNPEMGPDLYDPFSDPNPDYKKNPLNKWWL